MQCQWRDISIPISPEMTVWPRDPSFTIEPASRIASGAVCNISAMTMSTHAGTHCDAPWHFIEEGAKLDEVDTAVFIGKVLVIDLPQIDLICAVDLPTTKLPERVIFKTRNSFIPVDGEFDRNFVALHVDAAERLVADGVKLAGIDYLSISPYGDAIPVHRTLLEAGVFIVEGLRLADIAAGVYDFIVLPLPIVGADGAPCRAFIYA
ncbi:MAG: cyclase family protein [Candidatus Hydrogenedentes bacterium]|nr:cyclase family protein [Candidatus Hydrogenedentota bacterium]